MSVLARAQITIIVINDGPTGPTGKRMLTGMVHYQLSNASAPAKPSATAFNFATRIFSGLTANWAIDSPVYASGNANKYWYCTYTVEESTSGSGTGTPVFGTVKQAIGFSGLVTFTGDQSVTDGTKTLSFGAAGTTKIDGGNIETGTVSADRIDVDNLVVKQAVIGKIQDVAGPLASTAKSEAISAAAALDDAIQIGGRNLLLNSNSIITSGADNPSGSTYTNTLNDKGYREVVITSTGVGVSSYRYTFIQSSLSDGFFKSNQDYVLSFEYKTNTEGAIIGLDTRDPSSYRYFYPGNTNGEWRKGFVLLNWTIMNQTMSLFVVSPKHEVGAYIGYRKLKIEYGNKATDWTPAPEDVDADIATAVTTAASDANTKMNAAKDAIAQEAGYTNFADMQNQAALTVNGLLNSNIINTDQIFADKLLAFSAFIDNLTVRKLLTPIDSLNARVEIKEPTTADPYARITISGASASVWSTYARMFVESAADSGLDSPSAALEITTNYGTDTSTRGRLTVEGIEAYKVWGKNNPATSSGLSSMYKYYGMIVKHKSSGGEYAVKINITYNKGTGTIDFILDGLPTANPGGSVTVWKDSKGFLRIGAAVAYTAADVGAVPTSRTVNNKALSADISLTAADVGALPTNTIQYFTQAQWAALTQAQKDAVPLALVQE